MSLENIPAIILAIGSLIVSVATLVTALRTHNQVNSKLSALVVAEKTVSFDQGVKAEAARQSVPSNPPPVERKHDGA